MKMAFSKERRNKEEWEISTIIEDDKLKYMTITHIKSGICLGSKPMCLDENCNLNEEEKNNKIFEVTKYYLIQELIKLDKGTRP